MEKESNDGHPVHGLRIREANVRKMRFKNYAPPAHFLLQDKTTEDRILSGMFMKIIRTLEFVDLTNGEIVPNYPREMNKLPLPYVIGKLVFGNEVRGKIASRDGTELQKSHIREIDDSMRDKYEKLSELIIACISNLCHPIDLCALILISVAKNGPSEVDRENLSIGCIMANIVLQGYSYHLIDRKMQNDEIFQTHILECAISKENEKHVVFVDPVRRRLQELIDNAKNSCQACGSVAQITSRCMNCKYVFYCDKTCQKRDWPSHKDFCKENSFSEYE